MLKVHTFNNQNKINLPTLSGRRIKNMKKALIAGAASLAVAAMPVVGVMAAGQSQTDTITVSLNQSCEFSAATHADGSSSIGSWTGDTLSGTLTNGSNTNNYGSTTMTVVCNNQAGWQVTVAAAPLAGQDSGQSIAPNASHSATQTGYSWTVSKADVDGSLTVPEGKQDSNGQVASLTSTTDAAGETFTVTYGVGISETQAADTYTGNVVYTLANL